MKNTKKVVLILTLLLGGMFSIQSFAQGESQTHEIGFRMAGLNSFGFIYKKQKAENRFVRFRMGYSNFAFEDMNPQFRLTSGVGFAMGWEKRIPVVGNLKFVHGFEPFLAITYDQRLRPDPIPDQSEITFDPGLGYVLGFQYDFSEKFYVNIETAPSVYGRFSLEDGDLSDRYYLGIGFNSNAITASLVFKFQKAKKEKKPKAKKTD